jgi:hypothetical protein
MRNIECQHEEQFNMRSIHIEEQLAAFPLVHVGHRLREVLVQELDEDDLQRSQLVFCVVASDVLGLGLPKAWCAWP